jgi:adenosylhomocysteinase
VVITATGARNIINEEHIDALKPGVFLLNVGHVAHEIDVTMLERYPKEPLFPHVDEYRLPDGTGLDKRVYLLAGGSMINLTAGRGDSINAFDVTLAVLVGGVGYIAREGARRSPGLYLLPEAAWRPFVAPGA